MLSRLVPCCRCCVRSISYNDNVWKLAQVCNSLNNYRVEDLEPQLAQLQSKSTLSDAEKRKAVLLKADRQATMTLSHLAYRVRQTAQAELGYEVKWLSLKEIYEVCYVFLRNCGHDIDTTVSDVEKELALVKASRWGPLLSVKTQGGQKLYRVNILMEPNE